MKRILFVLLITISLSTYSQDKKKDGPFIAHFDNGNVKREGTYRNNKKVGTWKSYYETGALKDELFYDNKGKRTRVFKTYFKNGVIKYQVKKEGKHFFANAHYESGMLFYERILDNGYYKEYYEDGSLKVKSNYVDYQLVGVWTQFYKTGEKEWEINYKKGYREGFYRYYYKTGELNFGGQNKANLKSGKETHYDKKGNIIWKGVYLKGKPNGLWINSDADGNVVGKLKYKNGMLKNDGVSQKFNPVEIPEGVLEQVPIYPGCESYLGNRLKRSCMSKKISHFVSTNFNSSFLKSIGLTGQQKVNVIFNIDDKGQVKDIKSRSSNASFNFEVTRVLGMLPKFTPGKIRNKPVTVPYSLPIIVSIL